MFQLAYHWMNLRIKIQIHERISSFLKRKVQIGSQKSKYYRSKWKNTKILFKIVLIAKTINRKNHGKNPISSKIMPYVK